MRIYTKQKSEKPGGIYFNKDEDMEHFILEQILEMGFKFKNYRWCFADIPVQMGEFLHNPNVVVREQNKLHRNSNRIGSRNLQSPL